MALSIASLDGENQIIYNTKTPNQPHPEVNLPCTRQKLERLSSFPIEKLEFIRCDEINSYTKNLDIRSNVVTTTPGFHIIFEFTCTRTDRGFIRRLDSTLALKTVNYEIVKRSIDFNLLTPIRKCNFNSEEFKKAAYETMAKELEHWPLGAEGRRELIEFAWEKVCDVAGLVPTNHNVLYLSFHTILTHYHWYEQILSENCSICLKEYFGFKDRLKSLKPLPCSHVFHNHCIEKWLEICSSAYRHCPLCRSHIG